MPIPLESFFAMPQNLWNETEAQTYQDDLALRVYTSRLLGRDQTLVMHGGGNTSVKSPRQNLFGETEDILFVKGSGWDLETIRVEGFAPCRMDILLRLAHLSALSDTQMADALRQSMTTAQAPSPSVEAILHAVLPFRYVDHTHADAIIAITNTADGRERIQALFGERVVIVPYIMPGFRLAQWVAQEFPRQVTPQTEGMILLNHGIFTFGDDAHTSYTRMINRVGEAEIYLTQHNAQWVSYPTCNTVTRALRHELAHFRRDVSQVAGKPMLLSSHQDAQSMTFIAGDVKRYAQQAPLTPDHVIRTKRLPLIGRDLEAYQQAYEIYFAENLRFAPQPLTMLDPAPRIVLDPEWGMMCIGQTAKDTRIAEDIYRHTMTVIASAEQVGGYVGLSPRDIFEVEYWELEQAKLRGSAKNPPFMGEIALVTGGASGIGKACVESLLARGACVIALDINPVIETLWANNSAVLGVIADVTDESALENALERGVRRFGGLDMVVLNAGIFPAGVKIAQMSTEVWQKVMRINLDSTMTLMRLAHPLLKVAPKGGRVVVVGSKNVPAPGVGAGAYSASKAAITQLARVAAFEWGDDTIRINIVHPNAVFDTGLWTEEVLANRAAHYGMTIEQYKTNNVLHVEVTSHDVGELVAELCGRVFAKTTGAQIPIDGGNERVI
jgi:rhamnose utilization protein RhaD (predicted bifunctional aldolase and dehydrogenase)/NAD(P)-dependent dehydrogenase (short-subunit alcohol dehydrogenase family)